MLETNNPNPSGTTRRRLLQTLALVTAQGAACSQSNQEHEFSIETLQGVSRVNGSNLTAARVESIQSKVERKLAEIAVIRELDLDERIEPAVVFRPRV